MQPGNLTAQFLERLVGHLIGAGQLERLDIRLERGDEGVSVGPETDRCDLGNPDTGLRRNKDRQRLVFDLLQPPDRRTARWVSICEEPPPTSQPLGVLCVAPEDTHLQRASVRVMADELGRADALTWGEAQVADLDSKRRQSGRHAFHGRHPRRGSERHPHQCPDRNAQAQPPERTGWRDGLECDGADGGRRHEPRGEHSSRAHELRAGHGNHGDHESEPQLGEAPPGPQVGLDRQPVCFDHTTEHARHHDQNAQCDDQVPSQVPATATQGVRHDRQREENRGKERRMPERRGPAQHRDKRSGNALVLVRCRLRDHGREHRDQCRRRKEHDVDRPAVPPPRIPSNEKTEMPG